MNAYLWVIAVFAAWLILAAVGTIGWFGNDVGRWLLGRRRRQS